MKATKWMKPDRKFNNKKFSIKMWQKKTYLKAKKYSKFHRCASLRDRLFELIIHTKVKEWVFPYKFWSYFISCGFAYCAKSWIQLQTNTVHCHFCFLNCRQLLWICDLYSKLTWKCTNHLVFLAVEGRKYYSPERFEGSVNLDIPLWGHLTSIYVFPFHFTCQRSNLSVLGIKTSSFHGKVKCCEWSLCGRCFYVI